MLVAMSSVAFLIGCRDKATTGQTISRTQLSEILKATGRADSLTKTLESEFSGRGYSFSVAFSSSGLDSDAVATLSGGPSILSVYGPQSFKEAIELDREIHKRLDNDELVGIEIRYQVQTDPKQDIPTMYPASTLIESAEFFDEIKKRQQGVAPRSATRSESDLEGGGKLQPESEERLR